MLPLPTLLSEVGFGSLLAYSPRGQSDMSVRSRSICHRIKVDGFVGQPPVSVIAHAVMRLRQVPAATILQDWLGPDVLLVPCPRSAPRPPGHKAAQWVALRICEALRAAGHGAGILPCLERTEAVPKSAFADRGARPSVRRHVETMSIRRAIGNPVRITVVDDVITKGATLLAAASLVAAAFPNAEVRTFALVRTMGLVPDVERIVDPVVGRITHEPPDGVDRQP